jgi:hypothetical protein
MTPYLSEPKSGVAGLFLGTLNDAKWSPLACCLGRSQGVAVADAVLLAGLDTVKANVELVPKLSSAGLNFRPVSCATVRVSPRVTAVLPSASSTVPSEGNAITVTSKADEAKSVSVGAGIAIAVAKLFLATVNNLELAVNDIADSTAEWLAMRQSQSLGPITEKGCPNKKGSVLMRTF